MKFEKLVELLQADILNCPENNLKEITGGYSCDMISWVLSRIEDGQAWITILNSRNVIAAASMADICCIILVESVRMDEDVISVAASKSIPIISTALSAYDTCATLSDHLKV